MVEKAGAGWGGQWEAGIIMQLLWMIVLIFTCGHK